MLGRTLRFAAATLVAAALPALVPATAVAAEYADYRLELAVDPPAHGLDVQAVVTVPAALAGKRVEFLLADKLEVVESEPRVERVATGDLKGFSGINGSSSQLAQRGALARYRVQLPAGSDRLTLHYRGRIDYGLDTQKEEYARGFRETPGTVGTEGVYLAGSTLWYPFFGEDLLTFDITTNVPEGWQLISQGNGTARGPDGRAKWNSGGAMDEIYLVGGPLRRYTQAAGDVEAEVFLHQPDDALARKYLAATAQYVELYRRLIGPYPYRKFALVENFWETGYGMPSFTLLGPQIIRFPFIITSSYPHEILHNWWGNSVFVDYLTGNWCEGLTAYMADHLFKEQGGQGAEFRRDDLKKYRDYVKEGRDFPLTEFRSRHSAATEAVGYGKTLMLFHMLRRQFGDDAFRKALAKFYRDNRGRRASFDDVRKAFTAVTGADLTAFFDQWVKRTGSPQLDVQNVHAAQAGGRWRVTGTLRQLQKAAPYTLQVPVYVTTAQGVTIQSIATKGASTTFAIDVPAEPTLVEVDPEFDLFRLLDPRETAPSIGQVFGEPKVLAVLPSGESEAVRAAYSKLMDAWRTGGHDIAVTTDDKVTALPPDRAIWLLGRTNRLAAKHFGASGSRELAVNADGVRLAKDTVGYANHSLVIVRRNPGNVAKAMGWIAIDPDAAFEGIARKLPHYGKYSYLAFEGTEPANTVKGEWAESDSPLRIDVRDAAARAAGPASPGARPKRVALAELPAVFDEKALRAHVEWLAAPEREGRGVGTKGLDAAAEYVAQQMKAAGLKPGVMAGAGGGSGAAAGGGGAAVTAGSGAAAGSAEWFQTFRLPAGPDGKPVDIRNVVGVLPAAPGGKTNEAVLITAHYDHLGRGWPGVRAGLEGQIHPGADDNASGVAVMLELAKVYAAAGPPARNLVFVGFSGEEAGLRGSRYYVEHATPVPLAGIRAVVNLDTVGRLGSNVIDVLGAGSAKEWGPIFQGVGFTTGIKLRSVEGAAQSSSDQLSFIEKGVPGVQLFTGAHLDYHRPSDTADKIDAAGMVKVATVVREAVDYLLERPEPLTAVKPAAPSGNASGPPPGPDPSRPRRASLGTMPDFAFQGAGIRIESVIANSPAAVAGLQPGDVIVAMDGQPIADLQAYSDFLKTKAPGNTVKVTVRRGSGEIVSPVTLGER